MYKVRSENGYGFLKPGLKTGVGNCIFWSEIGSGFGDAGGRPPPKIQMSTPPPLGFKCSKMLLEDGEGSSKATKQTRTRRRKTFKYCKMLLEHEGNETRSRGCKYPTPPCALSKILAETTVRA